MAENYLNKLTRDHSKPLGHDFFQFKSPRKALSYLNKQLVELFNKNNQTQGGNSKGFDHALDPLRNMMGSSDNRPSPLSPMLAESTRSQASNNTFTSPRNIQTNNSTQLAAQQKMMQDIQSQRQQATQQPQSTQQQTLNQRQIEQRASF